MIDQLAIQMCARLAPKVVDAAKAGYKAHLAGRDHELAQALSDISLETRRVAVVAGLKDAGLTDGDAERIMNVFRSDPGVEVVRQIIIYSLALTPSRDSLDLLFGSVQAFLSLHEGREADYHLDAAKVLAGNFVDAMTALKAQLRGSDIGRELYRDLQAEALQRRLESALFGRESVKGRVPRIAKLMADDVHVHAEDESIYAQNFMAENAELEIPTLSTKQISLPFEKGYVMPTVDFEEEGNPAAVTSLYDYVVRCRNVVILGDPGAGKSTGIKHLARQFVFNHQNSEHAPLPFVVTLRHYAEVRKTEPQIGFIEFISRRLSEDYHSGLDQRSLIYLLHVGRAAIFFDGFDEVLDFDLRKQVAQKIAQIAYAFPSSIFVTSAREVGYDQNPIPRFRHRAYVGPFDDSGVNEFVDNYLKTMHRQGDLSSEKFMLETKDIADLRSNPLLLGVLCSLYSLGRTMPNNRAELYRKCGEMIFDAWDTQKSLLIPFEYRQFAEDAIRSLALRTFRDGVEEMRESELKYFLENFYHDNVSQSRAAELRFASDTLVRWKGRMWVLVYVGTQDGEDYYRFAHRSFLEFFAAEQTVYDSESGVALWRTLNKRLEERVAISYSLICIELLGARSRGALDGFYKRATARINKLGNDGSVLEALNLTTSMFEALACTRSNPEPRRHLMIEGILAFAQTIPHIQMSDPYHLHVFHDGIGYSRLFEEEVGLDTEDAEDVDELARYSAESVSIQGAASMFQSLARLRDVDREIAIASLFSAVRQLHAENVELALRLTMTIQQIPAFETWDAMRADLREEIQKVGCTLWDELTSDMSRVSVWQIDDLWLRIALLRNGLPGWGALLEKTGLTVFFEAGWPFPIQPSNGFLPSYRPAVYMVVQAIFGIVDAEPMGEVLATDSECRDFSKFFTIEDQEFCLSVEAHHTPGFVLRGPAMFTQLRETEPSDRELWISFCLLVALEKLGDRPFLESFVSALKDSLSLGRMLELRERLLSTADPVMFTGESSDIELKNDVQVSECLRLFETISDLAGL